LKGDALIARNIPHFVNLARPEKKDVKKAV
jgi:hypothetical protein